jgi:hypothetical protein
MEPVSVSIVAMLCVSLLFEPLRSLCYGNSKCRKGGEWTSKYESRLFEQFSLETCHECIGSGMDASLRFS